MRGFGTRVGGPGLRRSATALALTGLCLAPGLAHAQVLEIGEGGSVTVHDRPEVTSADGAVPIVRAERRPRAAARSARAAARRPPDMAEAAQAANLSPDLIEAVAWRESGFNSAAVSPKGAVGPMQLMPGTARDLGVDRFDPRQNLSGGAAYLGALVKRYDGDMMRALAAYNAGPGAVDRYGGVPPFKETRDYVSAILDRLSRRADIEGQK